MSEEPVLTPAEVEALLDDVSSGLVGKQAYTPLDRYRDFRAVFLATDQGKRVLYEIMGMAHMYRASFVRGDPYATHYKDGERNMALRILTVIHNEPVDLPERATSTEPEGDQ